MRPSNARADIKDRGHDCTNLVHHHPRRDARPQRLANPTRRPGPSLSRIRRKAITTANKATVETILKSWMDGAGSLQDLVADEIEWTITGNSLGAGTTHGRAELNAKVLGPFGARFSHSSDRFRPSTIHGIYGDGDTVIVHLDGAGVANDGLPYTNSYVWILTLRDGKAVRATAFFDSIAFDELWRRVPAA
jgi:ketosteroid isomerase-like protein